MTIAIDCDEVLADFLSQYLKFCNKKFNTQLKMTDFFTYKWWQVTGRKFEEMEELIFEFFKSSYMNDIQPVLGAVEGVKELKKNHKLVVVTGRPFAISGVTDRWLNKYFPNCFDKVYYTKSVIDNDIITKADACREAGAEIIIDDQNGYAELCSKNGVKVLLFDYPWNQDFKENKKVKRIFSWREIIKEINK